jgi:hypothetical protein
MSRVAGAEFPTRNELGVKAAVSAWLAWSDSIRLDSC